MVPRHGADADTDFPKELTRRVGRFLLRLFVSFDCRKEDNQMGLEDFSLPSITIIVLAGLGIVLLTERCASRFEHWWWNWRSRTG